MNKYHENIQRVYDTLVSLDDPVAVKFHQSFRFGVHKIVYRTMPAPFLIKKKQLSTETHEAYFYNDGEFGEAARCPRRLQ